LSIAIAIILCCTARDSFAQITYMQRAEFQIRSSEPSYTVIPIAESGLFIFRDVIIQKKYVLELQLLDSAMNRAWNGYIPIDNRLVLSDYDVYGTTVSILLRPRAYIEAQMVIINIDSFTGEYLIYNVDNPLPIRKWGFRVKEDGALIGGYFNDRPLVYYYNFNSQRSRILPGFFNEPGEINQIEVYRDGTYEVITSAKYYDKSQVLWIKSFMADGTLISNNVLKPEDRMALIFGRGTLIDEYNQMIVGVYGKRGFEFSRGIFTGINNVENIRDLKYYSYADMENFFNYLRSKQKERVKERIQRKKIKGRKIRLSYRLFVQEIMEYDGQYVMIGQAFYPRYKSSPNLVYGNPYGNNLIFDGYRYTHAVIIGFDKEGNILWDNSFETRDITSFELKDFVRTYNDTERNRIVLLYMYNNEVKTKIIKEEEVIEGKNFKPLPLSGGGDEIVRTSRNSAEGLEHWYDNYFVTYGTQTIKNRSAPDAPYRTVFFINKFKLN